MRIAFVTRDIGGFNATYPIARALAAAGHEIHVHATQDQRAAIAWQQKPVGKNVFRWTPDHATRDVARGILTSTNPDVVVAAMGSPIDIEETFGFAANDLGTPLVHVSDVWGSHGRSKAKPDVVLVADNYDARLVVGAGNRACVVGSPLLAALANSETWAARDFVDGYHTTGQKIVLLAGQDGPVTTECGEWLANSFKSRTEDPNNWVLIPRIHPKFAGDQAVSEIIASQLAQIEERGVWVVRDTSHLNAYHLAMYCDMTVSTFSTTLMVAAWGGQVPVSVNSLRARESMWRETGREVWPLVEMNCAMQVSGTGASNLDMLLSESGPRVTLAARDELKVLDILSATSAIAQLA